MEQNRLPHRVRSIPLRLREAPVQPQLGETSAAIQIPPTPRRNIPAAKADGQDSNGSPARARVLNDRQPPCCQRLLQFPLVAEQRSQIILHTGTGGIDFGGAADRGHRLRMPADLPQRRRHIAMDRCQPRISASSACSSALSPPPVGPTHTSIKPRLCQYRTSSGARRVPSRNSIAARSGRLARA